MVFGKLFGKAKTPSQTPPVDTDTPPMDDDHFWQIVEITRDTDPDAQNAKLDDQLANLSPTEILAFDRRFRLHHDAANRHDLWAAAYILNGGCSDDGFTDFRSWLIAQGRGVYSAALSDPETLADHVTEPDVTNEEFAYAAMQAFEAKTGTTMPLTPPGPTTGTPWDEATVEDLFPRLATHARRLFEG